MPPFFDPTPEEVRALEGLAGEIPGIQQTLIRNSDGLTTPDRAAHQQQVAGSIIRLTLERQLPAELDGLGLFTVAGTEGAAGRIGIGRISTGLGCPHAETEPDFLGLMAAFRTAAGQRVDFVTINDPTAPTDTPAEFIALLKATADSARNNSEAVLLVSLARHAGLRAPIIATHVLRQTARTVRSSSAYQPYWTGVVRAQDTLGKFTFVPTADVNTRRPLGAGPTYLTDDWRRRQSAGPLVFDLYWIPFVNDDETPLGNLTRAWREDHRVKVGRVTFPQTDPQTREARLVALLAAEMGANPGNWVEQIEGPAPALPATEYTAARFLAYRTSQQQRHALPEDRYAAFFDTGTISQELAAELVSRFRQKIAARHYVPDVGDPSSL
jgi:hypothetical protein